MIGLYLKADLENVTDLAFVDPPQDPFLYTFKVRCTSCKEIHPNPVTINRYEEPEGAGNDNGSGGPRSDANLIMRCRNCKKEMRVSLKFDNSIASAYSLAKSGSDVLMLKMDSRGLDVLEFVPDGKFQCCGGSLDDDGEVSSAKGATEFAEVDLEDNEWYDYDDNKGNEVSITNIEWALKKIK